MGQRQSNCQLQAQLTSHVQEKGPILQPCLHTPHSAQASSPLYRAELWAKDSPAVNLQPRHSAQAARRPGWRARGELESRPFMAAGALALCMPAQLVGRQPGDLWRWGPGSRAHSPVSPCRHQPCRKDFVGPRPGCKKGDSPWSPPWELGSGVMPMRRLSTWHVGAWENVGHDAWPLNLPGSWGSHARTLCCLLEC